MSDHCKTCAYWKSYTGGRSDPLGKCNRHDTKTNASGGCGDWLVKLETRPVPHHPKPLTKPSPLDRESS